MFRFLSSLFHLLRALIDGIKWDNMGIYGIVLVFDGYVKTFYGPELKNVQWPPGYSNPLIYLIYRMKNLNPPRLAPSRSSIKMMRIKKWPEE